MKKLMLRCIGDYGNKQLIVGVTTRIVEMPDDCNVEPIEHCRNLGYNMCDMWEIAGEAPAAPTPVLLEPVDSWLPIFPGFYGTLYEPDETNEIEHINEQRRDIIPALPEIDYDHCRFDYDSYRKEIAENATLFIKGELSDYVTDIKFQSVSSPREYNFAKDSIDIEVILSLKNCSDIKEFIQKNYAAWTDCIKEHYTSCDGFVSSYSNDPEEWQEDPELLTDAHKLGRVLEFIYQVNHMDTEEELAMYYAAAQDVSLQCTNYTELTTPPAPVICNTCGDNMEPVQEVATGEIETSYIPCQCSPDKFKKAIEENLELSPAQLKELEALYIINK